MQRLVTLPVIVDHGGAGSRSSLLRNIEAGLFTAPVKVGRSNVWPESKVVALQNARIAGKSDEDIRKLVIDLMEQRRRLGTLREKSAA